jgi:hypothetical protein
MEATVSVLARIPKGEGYRLAALEKKRGSFIKPTEALCYYLRYTDATTKKRVTVPAGPGHTFSSCSYCVTTTHAPAAKHKYIYLLVFKNGMTPPERRRSTKTVLFP